MLEACRFDLETKFDALRQKQTSSQDNHNDVTPLPQQTSLHDVEIESMRSELKMLREEWRTAVDEEREHTAEHARALAHALGEQFERSAVQRAVTEAKAAALLSSSEEARQWGTELAKME